MTKFNIVFMNENKGKDVTVLDATYIPRVNEAISIHGSVHIVNAVIYDIDNEQVYVYIGNKNELNIITGGNGNKLNIPMS